MRTLIGPPLTMWLISDGLLTVQQEIDASILMPSELDERPNNKKRKLEAEMELTQGNSSKGRETPQIMVANVELESTNKVIVSISTVGTSGPNIATLQDIHKKFTQTCQLLKYWITETSPNSMDKEQGMVTNQIDSNAQTRNSVLRSN
jgi:hypothetical protein